MPVFIDKKRRLNLKMIKKPTKTDRKYRLALREQRKLIRKGVEERDIRNGGIR